MLLVYRDDNNTTEKWNKKNHKFIAQLGWGAVEHLTDYKEYSMREDIIYVWLSSYFFLIV